MHKRNIHILVLLFLTCIALITGFYYDEFTDIVFTMIFTGMLQNKPGLIFNNYECLFLLTNLFQRLQSLFKSINVYGLSLVLLNSSCIYLIIAVLYKNIVRRFSGIISVFLLLAIVVLLMNDYIFVQFTKTSIFCILLSLYYLLYEENKRKRVFFFFIAGLLLRAEAFWLIIFFVISIHWIYDRQLLFFKLKKVKMFLAVMLLIALAVSIFNKTVFNEDDARYSSFRPYKYTLLDFKPHSGIRLSKTDSIKLNVLQNYFFGDADTLLTISTYKKLGIEPHERFNFFSANNLPTFNKATRELHHLLNLFFDYFQFYILWLVTWGIIIFFNLKKDGYRSLFKYTGVFTFTIFFIAIITVYIKMEARVLNPLLICTIFYSVLFTSSSSVYKIPRTQIFISSVLILLSSVYLSFTLYNKIAERHKFDTQAENFIKYWKEYNGEKILIPDVFSWEIFGSKVFKNYAEVNQMRMISLDDGYMSMMKTHREYMYSITGSTHFYDYLSYIDKNKNNICFLGTDERIRLMSQYIEAVYKVPFHLIKSGNQPVVEGYGSIGHLKFYLYRLE